MRTPSADHFEGFFHAFRYILKIVDKVRKDAPKSRGSSLVGEIRQEFTTLSLLREQMNKRNSDNG